MTPLLEIIIHVTILTFATIMLGAVLRNREWTAEGLQQALGNRDQLPEPTELGGRAQRTASNTIEGLVLFVPIALVAHLAGADTEALLGAQIFFWARVIYIPIYILGIAYVRSLVWGVGLVGLAFMLEPLL